MNEQGAQDAQTQAGPATTININPPTAGAGGIVSYPPGPQAGGADLSGLLGLLAPNIQQNISDQAGAVARDVATQLHAESLVQIANVGSRISKVEAAVLPQVQGAILDAIPQIRAAVLADVGAISDNIRHDAVTQRHLALVVVGFLGAICLAFVVAYLAGSRQAAGIAGWAALPGAGGLIVAALVTGFTGKPKGA